MTVFQSKRQNPKIYLLKQIVIAIIIVAVLIIYENYILTKSNPNYIFYWALGCVLFIQIIIELFRKRIITIVFDEQKEQIHFISKDCFSRESTKTISYETAKVEIDEDTSIFRWFRKSLTLYFLKNKIEICSISSDKNEFSYSQLTEISNLAKAIAQKSKI